MLRRFFIAMLTTQILPAKKKTELDKLIIKYNSLFGSATFIGDQVLYDRDVWDNIREVFAEIINEFR